MKSSILRATLLALAILCSEPCSPQSGWTHFTFNELPSNYMMFCINADKAGNIWLGRMGDLEKFDGIKWSIEYYDTNTMNFGQFDIRCIRFDTDVLWASTNKGLLKLKDGKTNLYTEENTPNLWSDRLRGMTLDSQGNPWLFSWAQGLSRFEAQADTVTYFPLAHDVPTPMIGDAVVFADNNDAIWWYAGYNKLLRFSNGSVLSLDSCSLPILSNRNVSSIMLLKDNSICVAMQDLVARVYEQNGQFLYDSIPLAASILKSDESIYRCRTDEMNNLWFTINLSVGGALCGKALARRDAAGVWTRFDIPVINGEDLVAIVDFCTDNNGRIWIAGETMGIYCLTPSLVSGTDDLKQSHENSVENFSVAQGRDYTRTIIRYTTSGSTPVQLALYDVMGRQRMIIADEKRTPGDHVMTVDLTRCNLETGMYFIRLASGNQAMTRSIFFVK
jgi:hypothetical protein